MLTIQNIEKILGKRFMADSGIVWVVNCVKTEPDEYRFTIVDNYGDGNHTFSLSRVKDMYGLYKFMYGQTCIVGYRQGQIMHEALLLFCMHSYLTNKTV
jgi:hypothetical protein